MNAQQIVEALKQKFGEAVVGTKEFRGEQTLIVKLESVDKRIEQRTVRKR